MHVKMILFAFLALLVGHVDSASGNPYNVPPDILSKYRESASVKCPDLTNGNWEYIASGRGSCSQGSAAVSYVDVSAREPPASTGPPGCWMNEGGWGLAYQKRTTEQVGAMAYHRCSSNYKCIW